MANKYQYISSEGYSTGMTEDEPDAPEIAANGGVAHSVYIDGVDTIFSDYPHTLQHPTVSNTNSNNYSYDYRAEWYLLVDSSNGADFTVGETVTQTMPGINFTAEVAGFDTSNTGQWSWSWDGSAVDDYSNVGLLTIKNCGPTSGTGDQGPTGPTGGSGGSGGGPQGIGGGPVPIVGSVSTASWDVIGISQRITAELMGRLLKGSEIDAAAGDYDFSAIVYKSDDTTIDLTNTQSDLEYHFDNVELNHNIYDINDPEYIHTVTIYDANGSAVIVDAVSGGSGPGSGPSELDCLNYQYSAATNTRLNTLTEIEAAYMKVGTTDEYDSVHKVRQFYDDRNA